MKIDGIGTADTLNSIGRKQATEDQDFEAYLRKAYSDGDKQKLKEACKEFEALFLQMMYKQMKKLCPKAAFFQKVPEGKYLKICWMRSL